MPREFADWKLRRRGLSPAPHTQPGPRAVFSEGGLCSSCKTELGLESCGRWRVCPQGQVDAWARGAAHYCPEAQWYRRASGVGGCVALGGAKGRSGVDLSAERLSYCLQALPLVAASGCLASSAWDVVTDLQAPWLQMSSLDPRGRTSPKAPGRAVRTWPDLRPRGRKGEAPRLVCDGPLTVPVPAHRCEAGSL